jgi:hypothetical protein
LVSRFPFVVGPRGLDRGAFLVHRWGVRVVRHPRSASPRVGPPSEYDRKSLPAPSRAAAPPLELLPLQRMRRREPTHPGFASSRFGCGSRVSHPPAALRLPRPSGSFEPVTLMGFSPSKLSPPAEPWRLSTPDALLPLPLWKHVRDPKTTGCSGSGSATGRCSPRKSVADRTGVSRQAARCSPGVRRSRAFRSCVAPGFPRAPLSSLAGHRSCGNCRPLRVSIRSVVAAPFRQPYSPSALLAPRFRSACLEPAPFRAYASGSGDISAPVTRPRNVRDFSQRARGGISVPSAQVVTRPSQTL